MLKVTTNDTMLHVIPPSINFPAWIRIARVIEVTDQTIVCLVEVDVTRRFYYERETGRQVDEMTKKYVGSENFLIFPVRL